MLHGPSRAVPYLADELGRDQRAHRLNQRLGLRRALSAARTGSAHLEAGGARGCSGSSRRRRVGLDGGEVAASQSDGV
jgi:hypothetical protein